jgi:FAD synthetase
MNNKTLLSKYVRNSENVFAQVKLRKSAETSSSQQITEVIEYAKRYLSDAKYYGEKQQYATGLVSVAYCEGMLDALRLLKLVEFKWPEARERQ